MSAVRNNQIRSALFAAVAAMACGAPLATHAADADKSSANKVFNRLLKNRAIKSTWRLLFSKNAS